MSATHSQLFRRPVWNPRRVGWHHLECRNFEGNLCVWCWECVWPAEGVCELWLVNRPNAF